MCSNSQPKRPWFWTELAERRIAGEVIGDLRKTGCENNRCNRPPFPRSSCANIPEKRQFGFVVRFPRQGRGDVETIVGNAHLLRIAVAQKAGHAVIDRIAVVERAGKSNWP